MKMAEAMGDVNLPLSLQETDGYNEIHKGKPKEGRSEGKNNGGRHDGGKNDGGKKDGGVELPDPIPNPSGETQEQPLSEMCREIQESCQEMCLRCGGFLHRFHQCCIEEPNACEVMCEMGPLCCSLTKRCYKLTVAGLVRGIRKCGNWMGKSLERRFPKRKRLQGTDQTELKPLLGKGGDDDEDKQGTF